MSILTSQNTNQSILESIRSLDFHKLLKGASFIISILLIAFAFGCNTTSQHNMYLNGNTPLCLIATVTGGYLSYQYIIKKKYDFSVSALIVSILFGCFMLVGNIIRGGSQFRLYTLEFVPGLVFHHRIFVIVACIIALIGFIIFFYLAVSALYQFLSNLKVNTNSIPAYNTDATNSEHKSSKQFQHRLFGERNELLIIPLILFVFWLPYIIAFGPLAAFTSDTSHQMAQYYQVSGLELNTHFPFLVSFVFAKIYEFSLIFDASGILGIFFICMLQVAIALFVITNVITWLSRLGAPKGLCYASLFFFALVPLFPSVLMSAQKDIIHACFVTLFCLQILLLYMKHIGKIDKHWIYSPTAMIVTGFLVCTTRNNGIILIAVAAFAFIILMKSRKMAAIGSGILTSFLVWQMLIVPACGVVPAGYKEMLSVPSQMIGSVIKYGNWDELSEDFQKEVRANFTINMHGIQGCYLDTISDPTKNHTKSKTKEEALNIIKLAGKALKEDPTDAIYGAVATTSAAWYPFTLNSYFAEDATYVIPTKYEKWSHSEWFAASEEVMQENAAKCSKLSIPAQIVCRAPGLSLLFHEGTYTWLLIFLLGYAFRNKSCRKITMIIAAMFLALTCVLIVGPCASLRYTFPYITTLPIFLMLFYMINAKRQSQTIEDFGIHKENMLE